MLGGPSGPGSPTPARRRTRPCPRWGSMCLFLFCASLLLFLTLLSLLVWNPNRNERKFRNPPNRYGNRNYRFPIALWWASWFFVALFFVLLLLLLLVRSPSRSWRIPLCVWLSEAVAKKPATARRVAPILPLWRILLLR